MTRDYLGHFLGGRVVTVRPDTDRQTMLWTIHPETLDELAVWIETGPEMPDVLDMVLWHPNRLYVFWTPADGRYRAKLLRRTLCASGDPRTVYHAN